MISDRLVQYMVKTAAKFNDPLAINAAIRDLARAKAGGHFGQFKHKAVGTGVGALAGGGAGYALGKGALPSILRLIDSGGPIPAETRELLSKVIPHASGAYGTLLGGAIGNRVGKSVHNYKLTKARRKIRPALVLGGGAALGGAAGLAGLGSFMRGGAAVAGARKDRKS